MKPIIGVTTDVNDAGTQTIGASYIEAIVRAGGVPFIVPTGIDDDVQRVASVLDGLVLTGGEDVDPVHFGEDPHPQLGKVTPERDSIELLLTRQMLNANKPILGICRGMQLLNVVFGGGVYQDMTAQYEKPLVQHKQLSKRLYAAHDVKVEPKTKLQAIAGKELIRVNSFHHQAVKDVARPLIVSAVANDGIIEALESTEHAFVIGVQWHPEELAKNNDSMSLRIFESLVNACGK